MVRSCPTINLDLSWLSNKKGAVPKSRAVPIPAGCHHHVAALTQNRICDHFSRLLGALSGDQVVIETISIQDLADARDGAPSGATAGCGIGDNFLMLRISHTGKCLKP